MHGLPIHYGNFLDVSKDPPAVLSRALGIVFVEHEINEYPIVLPLTNQRSQGTLGLHQADRARSTAWRRSENGSQAQDGEVDTSETVVFETNLLCS